MRTTLEIDDEIHAIARRRAFEERRAIGDVISELARKGLAAEQPARPPRRLGEFAGQIVIADDFDETPQDWSDAIEESIDPAELPAP